MRSVEKYPSNMPEEAQEVFLLDSKHRAGYMTTHLSAEIEFNLA